MIWRPAAPILALLALASCSSPAEVTISTRAIIYQGLIFIGGNVNNPGLYPYSVDDRLSDLICAAGGLREGTDASQVELFFEAEDFPQKIDINRAGSWLLEALPDIGAATAQNIIAYREANGPFRNIDELLKVSGIGPATLNKIVPYVVVGGD